jgi:glycosyltransferase involved in cell wall biosynthesis
MKILCISEHYFPRVGGTVNYVYETCSALAQKGVEIELVVPGPQPERLNADLAYRVVWLDANYPDTGEPTRTQRYKFCTEAQRLIDERLESRAVDAVHVLFGLFLMEVVNTESIKRAGVKSIVTVHNLPPMECSRSWDGDTLVNRLCDSLRLQAVKTKNRFRLRRNDFSVYVTPSEQVKDELSLVLPGARIKAIGHGTTSVMIERMKPPATRRSDPGGVVQMFTAGGWAPHKRQHLIPQIATILRQNGMKFVWTIAGPSSRVPYYREMVENEVARLGLGSSIRTFGAVPAEALAGFYDEAHLYIQPSTEEGFCLTALDAAAVGLPVIGSPAGALPEICAASGGLLFPSQSNEIAEGILHFVREQLWTDTPNDRAKAVRSRFSWSHAADNLMSIYSE